MMDNKSPEDLWATLMSGADETDEEVLISSSAINRQSAARLDMSKPQAVDSMHLRFTGPQTEAHQLAVRTTSKAILAFQESLSSVGASLMDRVTRTGKIPTDILKATELRFTPRLAPGSLEFNLVHPDEEADALFATGTPSLFDQSLTALLELFIDLKRTDLDNTAVVERLQGFGPRTAKHLFDLCQVLLQEDLGVNLEWEKKSGKRSAAAIDQRSAAYLKELAQNNTTSTQQMKLVGALTTVSEIDKQALILDDTTKITLDAPREMQDALQQSYRKRVEARVTETLNVNLTTGVETRSYALISINPLDDESLSSGHIQIITDEEVHNTDESWGRF